MCLTAWSVCICAHVLAGALAILFFVRIVYKSVSTSFYVGLRLSVSLPHFANMHEKKDRERYTKRERESVCVCERERERFFAEAFQASQTLIFSVVI